MAVQRNDDGLMSITEAAKLGYGSESTLRSRIREGKLKAYKVDGKLRVYESDLAEMSKPELYIPSEPLFDEAIRRVKNIRDRVDGRISDEQLRELSDILYTGEDA